VRDSFQPVSKIKEMEFNCCFERNDRSTPAGKEIDCQNPNDAGRRSLPNVAPAKAACGDD
jgi:hypothetical protein